LVLQVQLKHVEINCFVCRYVMTRTQNVQERNESRETNKFSLLDDSNM
jgi:hypothetical protein